MNKKEKKEYLNNILEMVLSGEENFELAESLISSLNLRDDFKNYAHKERDKKRKRIGRFFKRHDSFLCKGRIR